MDLLRKVHTYLGLFCLGALFLYACAGIAVGLRSDDEEGHAEPPCPSVGVELHDYRAPAGATDKQVADEIYGQLMPPLSRPEPAWALGRNADHDLVFTFYSVNGQRKVTVEEARGRFVVEHLRCSTGEWMNRLHSALGEDARDWRLRAWGVYNQVALWGLLLLTPLGATLGLVGRRRTRAAVIAAVLGAATFLAVLFTNL